MSQLEELKKTFAEEYSSATILKDMGRVKSAVILLSKALFALCDYIIFKRYKNLPKSHSERFRILEIKEKEMYVLVDSAWSKYTDTYSKPSGRESYDLLNSLIIKVIQNETDDEELKEILKESGR